MKTKLTKKKSKQAKKPKETAPVIPLRDSKILWARAAGRCSIAECHKPLTLDTTESKNVTLGEMAHIVGESTLAARGKSNLPLSAIPKKGSDLFKIDQLLGQIDKRTCQFIRYVILYLYAAAITLLRQ